MAFEFKLPDIGEGVVEGEIVKWLVSEGEPVREDQPVVEVMTDKATVELTSPRTGTVGKLHAAEGDTVAVGSVLVTIREDGAGAAVDEDDRREGGAGSPAGAAPGKEAEVRRPPEGGRESGKEGAVEPSRPARSGRGPADPAAAGERVLAMPAVRRLARGLGVEIDRVAGSGPRGRVLEQDVRAVASGQAARHAPPAPQRAPRTAPSGDRRIPFRGLRRKIADKMAESSLRTAAFTYVDEADCSRLVELRDRAKGRAEARGIRLTYLAFLAKAVARAIEDHPILNATLDEQAGEIVLRGQVNVGIAVDSDRGLIVPVVKDVAALSVFDIASEIQRVSEDARIGRSRLDDLQDSTFTITSVGSLGGMFATPIINYPEVAILGVNRIHERPVVRDGRVVVRHMTYFSLTLDHRIVDGADGARFMNTFKEYVEEPSLLFLDALE